MRVKSITGQEFEISHEEAKHIASMLHHTDFKSEMHEFFSHYQHTAAHNIQTVVEFPKPPACEKEVKEAIAAVLAHGTPEEVAEVLFESMEWETAYATLKSIE